MLDVYFEDYRVGTIAPTDDGPAFAYSADWQGLRGAFPVSLTMPLDEGSTRRISARRSESRPRPSTNATRPECAARPWST